MSASSEKQETTNLTENGENEVDGSDKTKESSDQPKSRSKRSAFDGPGRKNAVFDGMEEEEFK